jgi:HTH-type transcriptional regulator / antitoxin HigA
MENGNTQRALSASRREQRLPLLAVELQWKTGHVKVNIPASFVIVLLAGFGCFGHLPASEKVPSRLQWMARTILDRPMEGSTMSATSKPRAVGGKQSRAVRDEYMKLVRAFPLRPVRNGNEYELAGKLLNRRLGRPDGNLTVGERDYLDALVLLAEAYDRKHSRFIPSKRTPHEVLRYLAKGAGLGPTALGRVLGTTHAMASLMLHGKRGISAEAARTLANYFKVDAGLFI